MKKHVHGWQVYLAITFILLGILISTQIQTQNRLMSDLASQSTSDLSIMLKNLTDKRWQLTEELEDAENNLLTYQNDYKGDAEVLSNVNNELQRLQLINGTTEASGSGIRIAISGNLLASDLVVLINELWAAGAEAVAINNQRITATSGIDYVETATRTYLTCDKTIIQDPISLYAIGNGNILEKSLTMPGGISDSLSLYQIHLSISLVDNIHLPALSFQQELHYGKIPEK